VYGLMDVRGGVYVTAMRLLMPTSLSLTSLLCSCSCPLSGTARPSEASGARLPGAACERAARPRLHAQHLLRQWAILTGWRTPNEGAAAGDAEREPLAREMSELEKAKASRDVSPARPKSPPAVTPTFKAPQVCVAVLLLVGILGYDGEMQLEGSPVPAAKRCLAILVCVSALWATESIPLYVTSLLIPILTVATKALLPASAQCAATDAQCKEARFVPLGAPAAAKEICGQFFDPTVLLFMAGFSIGAVLEKFRLSNMIASLLLKPFGNKPENVLLGIMSLGCFLSMWIRCTFSEIIFPYSNTKGPLRPSNEGGNPGLEHGRKPRSGAPLKD
jgi:hypothetical protein